LLHLFPPALSGKIPSALLPHLVDDFKQYMMHDPVRDRLILDLCTIGKSKSPLGAFDSVVR
jgi:hypothetical protein